VNVTTPSGSSLATSSRILEQIEQRIASIPEVKTMSRVAGYGLIGGQGTSNGMFIVKLTPWDDRKGKDQSVSAVIGKIYGYTADLKEAASSPWLRV
jgi:HAE1 family hydrophobic/amphiphilic exporter-1